MDPGKFFETANDVRYQNNIFKRRTSEADSLVLEWLIAEISLRHNQWKPEEWENLR